MAEEVLVAVTMEESVLRKAGESWREVGILLMEAEAAAEVEVEGLLDSNLPSSPTS